MRNSSSEQEGVALVDDTHPGTSAQMWGRIAHAFACEDREVSIDLIVKDHIETDHSGALLEVHRCLCRFFFSKYSASLGSHSSA